jgi:hypothetical protein
MRRSRALKRGHFHFLSLLVAGMIGYVVGDWHALAVHTAGLTASQNVALRFPEAKPDSAILDSGIAKLAGPGGSIALNDASSILLSPAPMVGRSQRQVMAQTAQIPQAPVRVATAEDAVPLPAQSFAPAAHVAPAPSPRKTEIKTEARPASQPKSELKSAAAETTRNGNRPGFVLNDAQIASIKTRLHLSPDQEQMWPAVEAALRNIAYAKGRDGRRHNGADTAEVASLDPYGPEVQGLKSAAVPLIMSFSDEQRSEVRTLAHVMGLDQLASQL